MDDTFSSPRIHPSAAVHPGAQLHPTVEVGPFCSVGEHVSIGAHTKLYSHVAISGWTTIGEDNIIFPGAAIGFEPQDLKYDGSPSQVIIGDRNRIRECVTVNRATGEGEQTCIGHDNLLMAYAHVAHNCVLADEVVIANSVALAGYVHVESRARISGLVGVHQFTHIGSMAMVGGMARLDRDVPPFMMVEGNPGRLRGLNLVGLKRAGLKSTEKTIKHLKDAYRLLYRSGMSMEKALSQLSNQTDDPYVNALVTFLDCSLHDEGRRGPLPSRMQSVPSKT
ncbi:MAG: acyl-ACP--UDP-N-acetylglucosamine O-acyltransferase [Cyanobacteria bacterium P01_F01_bin.33]